MRETRVIALSNDAIALATSNFFFPIVKWQITSERTKSTSNVSAKLAWLIKAVHLSRIIGLNPEKKNPHYLTLTERLQNLPRGYSPKITRLHCIYHPEGTDELYHMIWVKDTIHTSYSFETDYQQWIINRIRQIWQTLQGYYHKLGDTTFTLEEFRPSILVLQNARSASKPEPNKDLATDEEFIYGTLLKDLRNPKNPFSLQMYDEVYREQRKRGVWEYLPKEQILAEVKGVS
jgi:hypothetical protein